jgi:predicted HicB family RNase H-like nuclease
LTRMGRMALNLPKNLHDEARRLAAKEGISINDYVRRAVKRQVEFDTLHEALEPKGKREG